MKVFCNKKSINFVFGDSAICLGKVFVDGIGAIFSFGVNKPIIWKWRIGR